LAHRRNADAIGEVNVAQAKFAEEMRHGSIVRLEKTMREVRGSLMPPAEPSGLRRLTALRKTLSRETARSSVGPARAAARRLLMAEHRLVSIGAPPMGLVE
jgi:hypothetical protein